MEDRHWDVLSAARQEARRRTGANVFVLPPERGDFRLNGRLGAELTFENGGGLAARYERGRIFVDMKACWYEEAARVWNDLPFIPGWSDDPSAHLCGRLLERPQEASIPSAEEIRLMRALMEVPHLLRAGSVKYRRDYARRCAERMRCLYARALARHDSLYVLRGCASVLARLIDEPVPVPVFMTGGKDGCRLCDI